MCLFAQKFSIGKEAAEDIVQEIFYKLYEERQIFHNILTLQSYLYSSVKNSCLNYIRDEKRRKLRESYYCDEIYNNDTTFINDVIENEVYRELYQLLDELPPQCRVIFERVLQGETSETKLNDNIQITIADLMKCCIDNEKLEDCIKEINTNFTKGK